MSKQEMFGFVGILKKNFPKIIHRFGVALFVRSFSSFLWFFVRFFLSLLQKYTKIAVSKLVLKNFDNGMILNELDKDAPN